MNWEYLKKVLEMLVYNRVSVAEFEFYLLNPFLFGALGLRQQHLHLSTTFKTKVRHLSLRFFCNDCNNH